MAERDGTKGPGRALGPATMVKVRGWLARARELFPLRVAGLLVGAVAAAGYAYLGVPELDLVFWAVGFGGAALVGGALIFVLVGAAILARRLRGGASLEATDAVGTLLAGRMLPTGRALPQLRFVPWVRVKATMRSPADAHLEIRPREGRATEWVAPASRGSFAQVERAFEVEDVLGLASVTLRHVEPRPLRVYPDPGKLGAVSAPASFVAGDALPHPSGPAVGDRVEIRRYVPGDPARFIQWKVFARRRELVVRTPERALERDDRMAAFVLAGPDDEASAAAAIVAIRTGALGDDWVLGASGTSTPQTGAAGAEEAVLESVHHRDLEGAGFGAFAAACEAEAPTDFVVFAPARPGPWLDRLVGMARVRPGRVRCVIGIDGARDAEVRPLWERLLLQPEPDARATFDQTREVLRVLAADRIPAVVVDRRSGRTIGDAHLGAAA